MMAMTSFMECFAEARVRFPQYRQGGRELYSLLAESVERRRARRCWPSPLPLRERAAQKFQRAGVGEGLPPDPSPTLVVESPRSPLPQGERAKPRLLRGRQAATTQT